MSTELPQEESLESIRRSDISRAREFLADLGFVEGDPSWSEGERFELYNTLSGMAFTAAMRADTEPTAQAAILIEEVRILEAAMRLVAGNRPFSGECLAASVGKSESDNLGDASWECEQSWPRH